LLVEHIYAIIAGMRFYVTRDDDDSIIYHYMLSRRGQAHPSKGMPRVIMRGAPTKGHDMVTRLHAAAVQNRSST